MNTCISPCSQPTWPIKLQFPLFIATVLTNKLVILAILFSSVWCLGERIVIRALQTNYTIIIIIFNVNYFEYKTDFYCY